MFCTLVLRIVFVVVAVLTNTKRFRRWRVVPLTICCFGSIASLPLPLLVVVVVVWFSSFLPCVSLRGVFFISQARDFFVSLSYCIMRAFGFLHALPTPTPPCYERLLRTPAPSHVTLFSSRLSPGKFNLVDSEYIQPGLAIWSNETGIAAFPGETFKDKNCCTACMIMPW